MLSKEEYIFIKKISDGIDEHRSFQANDLDKAIEAGNHLADILYKGFDLYIEQREDIFSALAKNEHNERIIFFDKEHNFDSWFNVVHDHYYPALFNINPSDLNHYDEEILMLLGRYSEFCNGLVPYMDLCVSYCLKLPVLFPDKKQEFTNIGKAMSAAFYLEKFGKIINSLIFSQETSINSHTAFKRCIELFNNAR